MTKNPSRSSWTSQRHLSKDYEWDTLTSLDEKFLLPNTSHESPYLPVTGDTTSERKAKKSASHGSDAIPKKPTFGDPATATPEGQEVSAGQPSSTISSPCGELAWLQLLKQTQELEIKKLQLQLQLANLGTHSSASGSESTAPGKSLGVRKALQKTLFLQPWPHIYAPGEPKL